MAEGADGGGAVAGAPSGLLVERGAVGGAEEGAQRGAEPAEGQQSRDEEPTTAADGEDGDEGGQADDGEGGRDTGDVLSVGAQRQGAAADRGPAPGPGLPGREKDDGGAGCPEEQAERPGLRLPALSGAEAASARGWGTGTALTYPTIPYRPGVTGTRGCEMEPRPRAPGAPSGPHAPPRRLAVWTARSTAAALLRHSVSSATGSESATTPAPAWTYAVPSRSRAVRMAMAVSESPAKSR